MSVCVCVCVRERERERERERDRGGGRAGRVKPVLVTCCVTSKLLILSEPWTCHLQNDTNGMGPTSGDHGGKNNEIASRLECHRA